MNELESFELLQQRIAVSELGREFVNDSLLERDIWSVLEIGYLEEESIIIEVHNIYFKDFSLPWLKLLAKLTAKASAREKCALSVMAKRIRALRQLDKFLSSQGYNRPEFLTNSLLQEFIKQGSQGDRQRAVIYVVKLWAEEQWLQIAFTSPIYRKSTPRIETIPEEILYQIYEKFDLFPPPLERLFRLQLALGCRIGEMIRMPRQCLKQEGDKWFLQKWVEKCKYWQFYQIHPLVAELIRAQQEFLNTQPLINTDFKKLFCLVSSDTNPGTKSDKRPIYLPKLLTNSVIHSWMQDFNKKAELTDKHGNQFNFTSHYFRRTKASIMAYCQTEDEYIAAVLGHASLDMLPHYRQRDLNRLEKEAATKHYVDIYGKVSTFKPRKQRYEKLKELLMVNTSLGECHRPIMLGDCEFRYACLSCNHHRVTLEDKPYIEADVHQLQQDLEQAQVAGQDRRVTEIHRLLNLLVTRLKGLEKLQNIESGNDNE
jgi:integrase